MLFDIVAVKVLDRYTLFLRFKDGKSGEVNIQSIIPFEGIFEPLKQHDYFKTVKVDKTIGTICWDNGADISPESLYKLID